MYGHNNVNEPPPPPGVRDVVGLVVETQMIFLRARILDLYSVLPLVQDVFVLVQKNEWQERKCYVVVLIDPSSTPPHFPIRDPV